MASPALVLRPGRDRSLLRRHPWVFSGAIATVRGAPRPGETVAIESAAGDFLAWGAFSPESQIRARVWSFESDDVVDERFISGRILQSAHRRGPLFAAGTDSARLVFSEADGIPGLVADRYGEVVVCQFTSAGADRWRDACADALASLAGVSSVFERSDADVREREGLLPRVGLLRGPALPAEIVATEGRWRFAIDVDAGHKTGFYLDQRDARAAVARVARGRRVMNVFSYTGGFSVAAADAGAASIVNIDSSGPALDGARRNGELNGVDVGELVQADAFTELRGHRDRARQYDLIVLDPPKLASSERQVDKASRAYKDLNLLAMKLLAPGGLLMTFSCSGAMSAELFQKVLAGAALDSRREVRIVGRLTQPSDHPIPLEFPEAEYLKGFVLEAE